MDTVIAVPPDSEPFGKEFHGYPRTRDWYHSKEADVGKEQVFYPAVQGDDVQSRVR